MANELPGEGRKRVVIEGVSPEIDGGRFPVKRIVGEDVEVEADAFTDGHDRLSCRLLFRHEDEGEWLEAPMEALGNDRWRARFPTDRLGRYLFTILAWVDHFETWRHDLEKRLAAGQGVGQELLIGAGFVAAAAERAEGPDRERLEEWARTLRSLPGSEAQGDEQSEGGAERALSPELAELMRRHPDRALATRYRHEVPVVVDRERARFSTWYELFPRSTGDPERHGSFRDVEELLPYVRDMGFDVVYLPPIHPIGTTARKGPGNRPQADPDSPGSPWAIGSPEGGHKAVHPELGTLDEFRSLVRSAREQGLEIALDIAFQCSPDHPWVREHPEWFRTRPDGSIQYAENPPKKYQDIYPFDFECEAWRELWKALTDVIFFWIEQGVRIFRVDNPHTKPFAFWEWAIDRVKERHPDVLFLSEAFTRPKVMYRLAKLGFSQSYTYFTWRNTREELRDYMEELTQTRVNEFFRPNFWPNTPDILPEYLQTGGRSAFMSRLVLAATLTSSYGIYGPAFELQADAPLEPGSEEYLHSEKYELRSWPLEREDSLEGFIARMNRIRRENPALQQTRRIDFHPVQDDELLAYSKASADGSNVVLVVVSLDPRHVRSGCLELDLDALGLRPDQKYSVHDLLTDEHFLWHGRRNFVELDPGGVPAHVFRVSGRARTEEDFEYYM